MKQLFSFETNQYLLENQPTLIEYAAFYGSVKIYNYLAKNKSKLTPEIWLYSIHSNFTKIFNFIDEVIPKDDTYMECLEEAIKCHHNDIATFIINTLASCDEKIIEHTISSSSFHYHNYIFLQPEKNQVNFFYACKFNDFKLVKILLDNDKSININDTFENIFN